MSKKYIAFLILSNVLVFSLFSSKLSTNNPDITNAPKKGIIIGKVLTENGTPIEYANIIIYKSDDSSLVTGGISKNDGSFEITDIPNGKYYLIANFIGFNKKMIDNIIIFPNDLTYNTGEIKLSISKTAIESVEVVADRARVEYKIDKKVVNVSQEVAASGGTAVEVLEGVPSVKVDIEGNITLRGSSSFTVLIDGKPTVLTGSDALQQIPATSIDNIEIITNPSAKYDPDGVGGIINVVLKKQKLLGLSGIVNVSIGTNNKYRGDMLFNYKSQKFNFYWGFNAQDEKFNGTGEFYRENYLKDAQDNIRSKLIENSTSDRDFNRSGYRVKGGLDYYINDMSTLTLEGDIGKSTFERDEFANIHDWDFPHTYDSLYRNTNTTIRSNNSYSVDLNFSHKFDDKGHEITSMVQIEDRKGPDDEYKEFLHVDNLDNPLGIEKLHSLEDGQKRNEFVYKIDYVKPINSIGKIEAGYQSRVDHDLELYSLEWVDTSKETLYDSSIYDYKRQIHSIYGTYSNQLFEIKYQLGLRIEYTYRNIEFTKNGVKTPYTINRPDFYPTIHFSRDIGKDQQLMLSYTRRIERPRGWNLEPYESYWDRNSLRRGNPDLQPEYINSYEFGYQKKIKESFIALEGFYRITENKIDRRSEFDSLRRKSIMTFDNLNRDFSLGAELMANVEATKWLRINASGSIYHYRLEGDYVEQAAIEGSLSWDARLDALVKVTKYTRLQLTGYYRGPSVDAQGQREAMWVSNFAVKQDLMKRKMALTLQVRDIFGTRKFEFENNTSDFMNHGKFTREPTVVTLTLSYKINNYKKQMQNGGFDQGNGGDIDGGDF